VRRQLRGPAAPRLASGERALAWATATEPAGVVVAGSRDALHVLPDGPRIPWEQVEAADWDDDTGVLRVAEVGHWGEQRPVHRWTLESPGRLLQLVRERVTATVLLQRHVPVRGASGVRVVARRSPSGAREIAWFFEYDRGVDPDDPEVRRVAQEALARAREEVGQG
jgi:hypothetical protein